MSAIFISHSSHDGAIAAGLAQRLRQQGHRSVFLDFDPADGIPPGRDWERELYHQLRSCQAVIALCSKNSIASQWCFAEITHAKSLGKHLFPIKVGPCKIDPVLMSRQVLDLARDGDAIYPHLWRALKAANLDPADLFDWDGTRPPFPGLTSFRAEDAAVFFGREPQIQNGLEILRRLRQFGGERFVLVLGASGSGKSSLVRAGLLPRLERQPDRWLVLPTFRPREEPLRELAVALARAFRDLGEERDVGGLRALLERAAASEPPDGEALSKLAANLADVGGRRKATLLVTVDQTEELLGAGDGGARLLALLRATLDRARANVMVLATLRSDFLGDLQRRPEAAGLRFTDLAVGPMPVDRLSQVIEGPARVAGLDLEPGLTETLVAETGTQDGLPLLAFTLAELYERYGEKGRLELAHYRELGGLEGSVARAAESVWAAEPLTPPRERDLRAAFLAMVRVDAEGKPIRRQARWSRLPASVHDVLERFVKARLLVAHGKDGEERVVEVAHDSIFGSWKRLEKWLDQDREFLLWHKRLRDALANWTRLRENRGALLTGPSLEEARGWLAKRGDQLDRRDRRFIRASVDRHAAERRRRLLALAAVLILLFGAASLGWGLWRRAEIQRQRANDQLRVNVAREWMDVDPTRAAMVLAEVEDPDATPFALRLLRQALNQRLGRREISSRGAPFVAATFEPSGERIAGALNDGTVGLWPVEGGKPRVLWADGQTVRQLVFSPDGSHVLAATSRNESRFTRTWWILRSDGSGEPIEIAKGLLKHDHQILVARFSPDGSLLAAGSSDDRARIFRVETGEQLAVLEGHRYDIVGVAWSPDGRRLATASADGSVRLWPMAGGGEPLVLLDDLATGEHYRSVSFSPDGRFLLAAVTDGTVRLWGPGGTVVLHHAETAETAAGSGGDVVSARFSADGSLVASLSGSGHVRLWKADGEGGWKGADLGRWQSGRPEPLSTSALTTPVFSPNSRQLLFVERDGTVRLWDLEKKRARPLRPATLRDEGPITAARFSPDGAGILTVSDRLRLFPTDVGPEPLVLTGQGRRVRDIVWSADGTEITSLTGGATVRVSSAAGGRPLHEVEHPGSFDARIAADGSVVVFASEDGEIVLWRRQQPSELVRIGRAEPEVRVLDVSADGRRALTTVRASATADRRRQKDTLAIWRLDGGGGPVLLSADQALRTARFSPGGDRVASTWRDGTARIWLVDGSSAPVDLTYATSDVRFDPSGSRLVGVTWTDGLRVWSAADGAELAAPKVPGADRGRRLQQARFSSFGDRLLVVGQGRLWILPSDDREDLEPIELETSGYGVDFSPDGTRVVVNAGASVQLWWADGRGLQQTLEGHDANVEAAAFSPDGSRLATAAGGDGTVRIWSLSAKSLRRTLRERVRICLPIEFRERALGEALERADRRWRECRRRLGLGGSA